MKEMTDIQDERPPVRTLILLAGLLSDETQWSDVAQRLRALADVRIISFPGINSIGAMAERVLDQAPPTFALVGHSMGGRVALEVVRRAAHRVVGLGLFNTGIHPRHEAELQSRGRLVELARQQGMSAVAAEWLPPMLGAGPSRRAEVLPALIRMVERAEPASFAAQTKALLERPDGAAALAFARMPTLLASGVADTWSPLAQHEEIRARLPSATLVAIEDAGHMAPVEQPQAVAAAIAEWLSAL